MFCPSGSTIIQASLSSTAVTVELVGADPDVGAVSIYLAAGTTVHIKFGDSTVLATTSDMTINGQGGLVILKIPAGATYLSMIGTGVVTLNVTIGKNV